MFTQVPVANMRESPDDHARVISQTFYGEPVVINKSVGEWVNITTSDLYNGWVKKNCICDVDYQTNLETQSLMTHIYKRADTEYGPLLTLPYGTKLELIREVDERWDEVRLIDNTTAYVQKGDFIDDTRDLTAFTKRFLGLPYTWGGRTSFGFDCSGFVQMVYKKMGLFLSRDAKTQIKECEIVHSLTLGDLIFWGFSPSEIKHVGIYLTDQQFIHTSVRENKPYLRISRLSDFEWRGEQGAFYPFRLFGKHPKKENTHCNFSTDEHEDPMKMAIDK